MESKAIAKIKALLEENKPALEKEKELPESSGLGVLGRSSYPPQPPSPSSRASC